MRVLLAQNSVYHPSHGSGDRSNRLPGQALAALAARIGKFGEGEQAEFLDQLAPRPAAASHAGTVIFERLRRRSTRNHP